MAPPHPGTYRGLTDEEKAAAPKFTKELGLRILSYLRPYKLKFFIVIVVVLLSAALGVVPSLLTGRMVDDGLLAGNFEVLVQLIIASFLVTVVSNALGLFETWLNTSIAQGIIYDMKTEMYAHFQKQPYQYFVESRQGEIVTRMTGDVNGVQSAVSTTMTNSIKMEPRRFMPSPPPRASPRCRWRLRRQTGRGRVRRRAWVSRRPRPCGRIASRRAS